MSFPIYNLQRIKGNRNWSIAAATVMANIICLISLLSSPYLTSAGSSSSYKNVYGKNLQRCSSNNMALSGYTRTGYCVNEQDDSGSHHICIDVSSTNGGNFCTVTGQNDWCSSYMQCDGTYYNGDDDDDDGNQCLVQNWCVCQWAFASYIEAAGGCDAIQDVVCESINVEAVRAYIKEKNSASKYADALDCLAQRCGINPSRFDTELNNGWFQNTRNFLFGQSSSSSEGNKAIASFILVVLFVLFVAGILVFTHRKYCSNEKGMIDNKPYSVGGRDNDSTSKAVYNNMLT